MLGVLTLSSMSVFCISVLAPEVAPAIGLADTLVGAFFSVTYLVAMLSGAATGTLVGYFGAVRVCQFTLLVAAAGLAAVTLATPSAALAGAVLLGLAYGPFNPASAEVLANVGTARARPFIFSVKQTGVPLGGALAGGIIPALALSAGWQWALLAVAAACLAVFVLLGPLRARFDAPSGPLRLSARQALINPVLTIVRDPTLRRFTLIAFLLAGVQVSIGAYLVVFLVNDLGMPLATAGGIFAALQLGATLGRLAWGAVASRLLSSRLTLLVIAVLDGALLLAFAHIDSGLSLGFIAALAALLGACSFGWNGVLLAQVASAAPLGRIGEATGGMQFFMFGGVVLWPPLFGLIAAQAGSFSAAFSALGAVALAAAVAALLTRV